MEKNIVTNLDQKSNYGDQAFEVTNQNWVWSRNPGAFEGVGGGYFGGWLFWGLPGGLAMDQKGFCNMSLHQRPLEGCEDASHWVPFLDFLAQQLWGGA